MATHTVSQPTANTGSAKAKNESGSFKRGVRLVFGIRPREDAAPAAEASTDTDHVTQPYLGHETNPDPVALNLIGLSALAIRDGWSSTRFQDEIRKHLKVLRERANAELAAGEALLRRDGRVATAVTHVAEAIEAAVKVEASTGVPANLNTGAMAAGLAALTVNKHSLTEQTLHFPGPLYVDGMADPREIPAEVTQVLAPVHPWDGFDAGAVRSDGSRSAAAPSPVHDDGATPPLPEQPETAPAPLPQRHPQPAVLPAAMSAGDDPEPMDNARSIDPTDEPLGRGDWLWDEGSGTAGAVWLRVADARIDVAGGGRRALIDFANGSHLTVYAGDRVLLLAEQAAKELLASGGGA